MPAKKKTPEEDLESLAEEMSEPEAGLGSPMPDPPSETPAPVVLAFAFEREHKLVNRFAEQVAPGASEVLGKIYLAKHSPYSQMPEFEVEVRPKR